MASLAISYRDLASNVSVDDVITVKSYVICGKFSNLVDKRSINIIKLECGPMPNVMVALPNIGGALCSTPQSLADAHY